MADYFLAGRSMLWLVVAIYGVVLIAGVLLPLDGGPRCDDRHAMT